MHYCLVMPRVIDRSYLSPSREAILLHFNYLNKCIGNFNCSWISAVVFPKYKIDSPFCDKIHNTLRNCILSLFSKPISNIRLPIFLTGNNNFNKSPVSIVGPAAINWGTFSHFYMCFWFRTYSDSPTYFLVSTSGYCNNRNRNLKTEKGSSDKILLNILFHFVCVYSSIK